MPYFLLLFKADRGRGGRRRPVFSEPRVVTPWLRVTRVPGMAEEQEKLGISNSTAQQNYLSGTLLLLCYIY